MPAVIVGSTLTVDGEVNRRLALEIRYESLYGGERYQVVPHPHR
ncbi:hypothetical protein OG735_39105 [Streptomyces sp. NBC_01210]|nr:hypothetical protein OG735_39105 [Streptomyces sp. NBC_01210]